jgi:hypothetical protein
VTGLAHRQRLLVLARAQAGMSAAIASTGRQVGTSLGVAVLGSLVSATQAGHLGWWILAGCGALVAVLGILTTTGGAVASARLVAAGFPADPSVQAKSVAGVVA